MLGSELLRNSIHIINHSDDKELNVAVYQNPDSLPGLYSPVWFLVNPNINSTARIIFPDEYAVFASYTKYNGQVIYETECIKIHDFEGSYKVTLDGRDVKIIEEEEVLLPNQVTVKIDRKVGNLINVNIVRGNSVYNVFPTSPGSTQEIKLDSNLYIAKVKSETMRGENVTAQSVVAPPSTIKTGQTAYIEGTRQKGYSIKVIEGLFSDNCVSRYHI